MQSVRTECSHSGKGLLYISAREYLADFQFSCSSLTMDTCLRLLFRPHKYCRRWCSRLLPHISVFEKLSTTRVLLLQVFWVGSAASFFFTFGDILGEFLHESIVTLMRLKLHNKHYPALAEMPAVQESRPFYVVVQNVSVSHSIPST